MIGCALSRAKLAVNDMTTLEELNQREAEEIELVRDKYAKLRKMVPHVCEPPQNLVPISVYGWRSVTKCKHCGAEMPAK